MVTRSSLVGMFALVLGVGGALTPQLAGAKPAPIDHAKVQTLANAIEAALVGLGCNATLNDEIKAIQSTIAESGADPAVAEVALNLAQASSGLCPADRTAIAAVDQTIVEAMEQSYIPAAGGPGPGAPIGGPPAFVGGGGGSDYVVK